MVKNYIIIEFRYRGTFLYRVSQEIRILGEKTKKKYRAASRYINTNFHLKKHGNCGETIVISVKIAINNNTRPGNIFALIMDSDTSFMNDPFVLNFASSFT